MLLPLINCVLGAICGMCFRVQILAPLIAFACIEGAILEHASIGWSVLYAAILIVAIDIGYLAGSAGAVLWPKFRRNTIPDGFVDHRT
jgi:hypothetical protein